MSATKIPLPVFGWKKNDESVHLYELCLDPDGSNLPWVKKNGIIVSLDEYTQIGSNHEIYNGRCVDTGEYTSHMAVLIKELINKAPNNTALLVVESGASVGTRSFTERVDAKYFALKKK